MANAGNCRLHFANGCCLSTIDSAEKDRISPLLPPPHDDPAVPPTCVAHWPCPCIQMPLTLRRSPTILAVYAPATHALQPHCSTYNRARLALAAAALASRALGSDECNRAT